MFVYKRVSSTHYSVYGLWSCCSSTVSRAGRVTRARAPAQLPRGARDSSQSQLSKLTKPQKPFLTVNKVENKRAYRLIFKSRPRVNLSVASGREKLVCCVICVKSPSRESIDRFKMVPARDYNYICNLQPPPLSLSFTHSRLHNKWIFEKRERERERDV